MENVSYSGSKPPIWKRFSKRRVLILIILIIVVGMLGGLFYFVTQEESVDETTKTIELPENTITDTPQITEEPVDETDSDEDITPTSAPTPVDESGRGSISVSVQNGSGDSGVAGDAADILRNLGYDVVSTGNADNFEYENVSINVKASNEDALALLEEDLSESYTISGTSTDLSEDESFDALVIIGS